MSEDTTPKEASDVIRKEADADGSSVPDATPAVEPDSEGEASAIADSTTSSEANGSPEAPPTSEEPVADSPIGSEASSEQRSEAKDAERTPRRRTRDLVLARAFRSRRPVSGRVVGLIKGGYEVKIGRSRGFCPQSQIDLHRSEDPEKFVGETLYFLVEQFRRGGEDVVVSRRALLEQERADEAKAVRATLIEGAITQGRVAGLAEFGCFVDLGAGVQGLVHVSEISQKRVAKVDDAVREGDVVRVKVLKIDPERNRISLSIRRAERDPWAGVGERFPVGTTHPGTVVRIADFGAFVELEPGVEALAPAREFPPVSASWSDGLDPGVEKTWRVLSVDRRRRRMSVVPEVEGVPAEPVKLDVGSMIDGRTQRIERFGVFVWLGPGQVGLMPGPLSGVPQGTRLDSRYRVGDPVRVRIVDVEEGGKRIRLAAEGVDEDTIALDRDRGEPHRAKASRAPAETTSAPDEPFGTTLGDALRAALGNRDSSEDSTG